MGFLLGHHPHFRHLALLSKRRGLSSPVATAWARHRGRRLWAERDDRDLDDVFVGRDEITDVIAATLAGRIEEAGHRHGEPKRPQDMDVYDGLLRGRHCLNQCTRATEFEARAFRARTGARAEQRRGLRRPRREPHS